MSFDDYAYHIYEKHRLATALAIIKSKPKNISTEEYLEKLKSDVGKMNDDDDATVCSDDFLMDDDDMNDSVTILKDFDEEIIGHLVVAGDGGQPSQTYENNSQTTFYESSQSTAENTDKTNSDTVKTAEINEQVHENLVIQGRNEAKELTTNINTNLDLNAEIQYGEKYQNNTRDRTINENTDATFFDSQETQIYTVYGFSQNYTHYSQSQSQNNVSIPKQYLYKSFIPSETKISNANNIQSKDNIEKDRLNENNINNCTVFDGNNTITRESMNNTGKNNNIDKDLNSNKVISQENNDTLIILNENNKDSDINKEVIDNNHSQYSQSIDDYFYEMQNFHDNNATNMDVDTENVAINTVSSITIANTEKYNENSEFNNENLYQFKDLTKNIERNAYTDVISDKNNDKYGQKNINLLQNKDLTECVNTNTLQNRGFTEENSKNIYENAISEKNNENFIPNDTNLLHNTALTEECKITEEDYDSDEIISYKVLEEFNKVKIFVRRPNRRMSCDSYSSDSGYRSDSQRSNRSALQLSGSWLNQSGSCLFNYILQCPQVASTRDITAEIAQVLGELIDKLHEEEKYPSFLEELLETIDVTLQQVFEGINSEENEFLKKDERIQRILLLNKSVHIQRHTIEKITYILEIFHSNITQIDSIYEIQNIDEIENVSYIFHILEILLKKYLKNKQVDSQVTTQNSQEILKKSSITDIWRKKWNPTQKKLEGSREKKCVLKELSDILNKIVVDCVSSYSLVAYSALKCFNSMQN